MFKIYEYTDEFLECWDCFVLKESVNGTFLQTRKFLNYHPKDRFIDASILVFYKNKLVAVIPGCSMENDGIKIFVSHSGSTYGGIVVQKEYYKAGRLIELVESVDCYLREKYKKVVLKITPDLFSKENSDLLQYVLTYCGFNHYSELNTYIDFEKNTGSITDYFNRNKIRNIKKCMDYNLSFQELLTEKEIMEFHGLLSINLDKYNLKPIHTVSELLDLKYNRIPQNIMFVGVYNGNKMMAAGMLFIFDDIKVMHAQNLSADYRFKEYSAIAYLYYKVIEMAKNKGYKALSWGISTEQQGDILNINLIQNKESYGSVYQLNRTFYKEY